jgi:hypothetical protein
MQTKRIIINSKDRDYNLSRSSSDFIVNLNNFILQNVSRVSVESVTITNVIYNVPANTNIYWQEGIGPIINRTLPEGSYTLTEFMDELKLQLNSIGSNTFDVTQDVVTKKVIITNPSVFYTIYSYSTINPILGLPTNINSVSLSVGPDFILNCPYLPNLGAEDLLYVHSRAISEFNSVTTSASSSSILTYISFHETAFGSTSTRFNNDLQLELINYTVPRDLTTVDVKVRNAKGEIVNLQNTDVIVVLKFYLDEF